VIYSGRALMAFRRGDNDEDALLGAMIIADGVAFLRALVGYGAERKKGR